MASNSNAKIAAWTDASQVARIGGALLPGGPVVKAGDVIRFDRITDAFKDPTKPHTETVTDVTHVDKDGKPVAPSDDNTLALAAGGPEDVCDPQHILGATLIGKNSGRDYYVESFTAGTYVLKHHCPLRQEDHREDYDWRHIWDHFKRAKGAGVGVAPKRVVVLKRGQQYVSEVNRPDREKGGTWTYDGPSESAGLHRFTRGGQMFLFSGDGWATKPLPRSIEGMTANGCLELAREVARELRLDVSSHDPAGVSWTLRVYDWNTPRPRNATERQIAVKAFLDAMVAIVPGDIEVRVEHAADSNARAVAAASIAASKACEQQVESLRFELGRPPHGYSVAVWHAYLATIYEKAEKMQPIDLTVKRFDIEAGRVEIPRRLLAADAVRLEKPVHAYRFDRQGGR